MASQKTELNKHIMYLEARRSGAEWCLGVMTDENDKSKTRAFIHSLSTSIQDNRAKLATIEQEDADAKAAEKAERAKVHKEFGGTQ